MKKMASLGDMSLLCWRKFLYGLMPVLLVVAATSYGDILDLTLVTNHPLLDPANTDDHFISAYLGEKHAYIRDEITFNRIERGKLKGYVAINEGNNIRKFYFNQSADTQGVGTFSAVAEFEGVKYTASTVVLLHNATIVPQHTTLTAHLGENVNIAVTTDLNKAELRWRFNATSIENSKGELYLIRPHVKLIQAGVYQCYEAGEKAASEHAYMLLHVRRCQAGLWGLACEHSCTECLNGGQCDADSGACICPPGFNGTACERALGRNRFGQDGSFSCDLSGNDHGLGCRGKLFCLPDPFGCTCAAGFMGINCTTECYPGTYGANCLQDCHCEENNCALDTGECINEARCQEDWMGVNCQVLSSSTLGGETDDPMPRTTSASSVTTSSSIVSISSTTLGTTSATNPATTPATTPTITLTTYPTYAIESFSYTKVNNGEPTNLVCIVTGSPPLPSANISVINALGGDEGIDPLETNASATTRTSWYRVTVGLDEVAQNFSCLVNSRDGNRVSKELAVTVYEPPSFNEAPIISQEATSHSITLSWSPWDEIRDYGDGPVIGYIVYYITHGENILKRASNDLITDTTFLISNLTRDTVYDVRVTAVRTGLMGEGTYSQVASASTRCSAPSEAPVLSVRNRGQTSITLGWELISEDSWGCSTLSGIDIIVNSTDGQDGFPKTYLADAAASSAIIENIQDCSSYTINAAFRNKDGLGISSDTLPVVTSVIRPGSAESLQMSPFKTQIEVNWESQSNLCPPDHYLIRYSLYQKIACTEPETTLIEFEFNTTSTRYNIAGLDPYSRYKVTVIAVNGAGQSGETIGYANTLAGRPSNITNVRVDHERTSPTSIGFTWQPLTCRNVNGVFWYYYPRIYKDGDRSARAAGAIYLDDEISYSSVEFDGLEPCTMYELNIYAFNRDVSNPGAYANGVTGITFTGASANAFGNLPSLQVWWHVPSQCTVDSYRLSYHLISRKACPDVPVIDAPVYELSTTPSFKRLSNLEYYAKYNISIIAVIRGAESLPEIVRGDTSNGVPSPIQSVSNTSTAGSLHFMWEEPSCENLHGDFNGYEYDLYNIDEGTRSSSTPRNDVQIHGLDACTVYRFRVRVVTTSNRRSEWLMETAMTNISAPGMPYITQLTQHQYGIGTTGLTVSWQPPTSPPCQPTNYEIKYYIRQGDMCEPIPSGPQPKLAGAVNGSTFTFDIEELRPYSGYRVFVIGNTTSGYGNSDSRAAPTGYSYPSGPPTNIRATANRKHSIVFTWEKPECGYRNGPITGYEVMLSDSKGVVVHLSNVSVSTRPPYEIFGLIPYSNYSISIRAWNYELAGEYGTEVWVQTDEAKPAPPEEVMLPSSDQESITVEWMSPYPPLGRIIGYYILYWEADDDDAPPSNVSIPCVDGRCSDINYRFSGRIPNLKSDTNYSVQVQAESSRGYGLPSPDPPAVRITNDGSSADPCTELDPCVNGDCRNIGQGQYECECQNQYEGIHCDEPTLPIEVSIHPSNQTVEINSDVELTCSFTNAKQYHWYRDEVLLPSTENQNPLIIPSVTSNVIGYYFCRGSGRNGETIDTMRASVYIKDLTNIEVLNVRFTIPFRDELYEPTSDLYRKTTVNISTYMKQGLRTSTGLMGLSAVCRGLRPGSIKADLNIYIEETNMTAFETQDLISRSLDSLANNSNGYLDSSIVSVLNIAICQKDSWMSPRFGTVDFPAGENGTWANSTGLCPFNTTQANGPIGRALCIGDGIMQSQWLPIDDCGPFRNVTDILNEIGEVILTEENAGEVSQQVSIVTTNTEQITSDDITSVAEITSQIVQQNLTSEEVTVSITSIVSNIAQVDTVELEAAEEESGAISQFVQAFEEQINRVAVANGGMLNIQQPNVAVQVQSVPTDDVMSGLVLLIAGPSLSDLSNSNITINAQNQDDVTATDIIAQVTIPPSVSSVISSMSPNGSDYVRVNFHLFSTPVLFISRSLRNISDVNTDFNRSANSPVISLSLGLGKIADLTEFINFTFTTIMTGYANPMCSFWDEEEEDWSQDGCFLVSSSDIASSDEGYDNFRESGQDDLEDERVRCSCNHLTNFAVIMDIHREEDAFNNAYNILTYIGCSVSIVSLLITLATYLWNKDLRTKQINQIFICLFLTLLCLYITFITMISLDSIRDYREVQAGPCGFLTALVHYFVLSSIAWMGVEGYNTYLIIVKIFNTYTPNFMKKAVLAAWGVPALIVVLTGAIARDYYAHDDLCFLQFWAQIGGLLIPMSIILIINVVIFILVVRQLVRSANISGRVKRETKVERRETIERVQNAICILLLLGLTWVAGYLLLIPVFSQVAQPIFIVLNSFQGMFIFLLYCVRKPHIRKRWGLTCFDKSPKHEPSTSSGMHSSMAASSSAGVISSLRPGVFDNELLPSKEDQPDPMCMFNPTYDVGLVDEGVTPPIDDVATVSLPVDVSVTKATESSDVVTSTTNDTTVSLTMDTAEVTTGIESSEDVISTTGAATVSVTVDAADNSQK